MECDIFYGHNNPPPFEGIGDRCHRREISAGTAMQVSILGMSTSLSGVFNLFISGYFIKLWGPRWAFVSQTSLLGLRVSTQVLGVSVGGRAGELVFQACQAIGIVGGPRGYQVSGAERGFAFCPLPPFCVLFRFWYRVCVFSGLTNVHFLISARPQYRCERGSCATR